MKKHIRILVGFFIAILLCNNSLFAQGQCLGGGCGGGGQYPGGTQTTTLTTFVTVSATTWAGDYAVYNVTSGQTYEWTLCSGDGGAASYDSELTLLNSTGATVICYSDDYCGDDAKIIWTATSTTTVRVLISQWNCAGNATNSTIRWRCVSCVACTTPGTPTSPAGSPTSSTSANLSWAAGSPVGSATVTYYWVVGTSPAVVYGSGVDQGTTTTLSAVTNALSCNTTYYLRVYALTSCNGTSSAYATSAAFVTPVSPCPVTYLHPTTGIASEKVGSCQVATSSGTYYDDGGAAGNYSNNIGYSSCSPFWCPDGIYRIFCPDVAGQCLVATFSSFSIEGGGGCPYDLFTVVNGSTEFAPTIWSGCGTAAIGPFTGTANGCLGFKFASDGTTNGTGWAATFSTIACAGGPSGTANNDCRFYTQLCSNASVASNSTGPGILAEACGGAACPAGGENYSNWFAVTFSSGGTFSFTVSPSVGTDDYDYAVFGPVASAASCSSLPAALRCSDAYLTGNTGLASGAGDNSEDVTGNKWTNEMNVLTGEIYFIMIDEWTPTGAGYNLSFGGTAVMSCGVILPVELLSFDAQYNDEKKLVNLHWVTETEINNGYFAVERSVDGVNYEQIDMVKGSGNSTQQKSYWSVDRNAFPGEINYYRLKQVDRNGKFTYSGVSAVAIYDPSAQFSIFPNPVNETAHIAFNIPYENECSLNIYDYTGKQMLAHKFTSVKGKNLVTVDLADYAKGIYFVTFSDGVDLIKSVFIKE